MLPPEPRKAGYSAPILQQMQVRFYAYNTYQPPRERGQRPYAITDRPIPLTPSTSSQLGVSSRHQELHRCALDGFLGPPSGTGH